MSRKNRRERRPEMKREAVKEEHRPEMREAGRDFIGDLKRTIIESGDAGRAPDLKSWSLGRRVARLEDLANCFRGDLHQLEIARDNHDERLSENRRRISAFQHFVEDLSHLPVDKIESTIGSLVADLAAKDLQIDKTKEELSAQRRTLGVLSARVEALENHRQDLSWRVSKQEQNQTALLYNDEANKISAEQFKALSGKVVNLTERLRIAEKILKQDVIDENAHARIDLLARCSGDHNNQLEELKGQVAKLEERSHIIAKCSDDQALELHKRFDAMTPKIEALVTQVTHLTKKYDELSTEQVRPVIEVDHRLGAMTRQIERLQDILTEIAEILPREFD